MTRQPYPSDLTDLEWEIIEPLLPPPTNRGKPRKTNIREVVNAILYILWRRLPMAIFTS